MIDIGKLLCGGTSTGDSIRYGTDAGPDSHGNRPLDRAESAASRRPIVVWSTTRSCNLSCVHCYTDSSNKAYSGEMTTEEGLSLIDDLAGFKVPSLLFSGGEPLMRKDIFRLIEHAASMSIRPVLSTNGTLIDAQTARDIRSARAMKGFENCAAAGQRVGLRLTLTKRNYEDLDRIFDFIEKEGINRACFYHLVYSGRGGEMFADDLTHRQARGAMDRIFARTRDFFERGRDINILTVDNHADGVYLYLKLRDTDKQRALDVRRLLEWNGGGAYSTGVGIANVDFFGEVHPDQFWQDYSFGNVRKRPFGEIWTDESDPLMAGLKHKADRIKGRCRLCMYRTMCTGSMRVRALRTYGDPWAPDPQCYLTDEEIGLDGDKVKELIASGQNFPMPVELTQ
jgi:radical SAM protein with 4Fe4S-binding SPASM domain